MADESLRLIVRQGISPGKLEVFKELARQMTAGSEAAEPGTLGYEWFIGEDETDCYLNEFYSSSEAFLSHLQNVMPKIQALLEISPLLDAIVFGDPSPEAREALAALGARVYTPCVGFCR
jgi:quinol monooxygenase YgiN